MIFSNLSGVRLWGILLATCWTAAGFILMILGFAGQFRAHMVGAWLLAVFAVLCATAYRSSRLPLALRPGMRAFLAALALYFLLLGYQALYPVTAWDALSYHLPVARAVVESGRIGYDPFLRFPVGPQGIDLFFAAALFLKNPVFVNLLCWSMSVTLFLLIWAFGKSFLKGQAGMFAAVFFICWPFVAGYAVIPYAEMGTALFCFGGLYALCLWLRDRRTGYLFLSALNWGLALGAKYYVIVLFLAVCCLTAVLLRKDRGLVFFSLLVVLAVLVAFPWYLRNRLLSGDWFFPFRAVDGFWSADDIAGHLRSLRSLAIGPDRGGVAPFFAAGAACVLFIRKWRWPVGLCAAVCVAYIAVWFFGFQSARYLFPVLPLLSVLAGFSLQQLIDMFPAGDRRRKWAWYLSTAAMIAIGGAYCVQGLVFRGPAPVTRTQVESYLAGKVPTFAAIGYLNGVAGRDEVVYALNDENAAYYYRSRVIGDWFGPAAYGKIYPYLESPQLLHRILSAGMGAKYLLINRQGNAGTNGPQSAAILASPGLFKLIYEDKNAYVFQIT